MRKIFRETSAGIAIATGIFFCGFFAATFLHSPPTKDTDAATWAAAFGSFAAFCAAIGIANQQNWRLDREKEALARVYAPGVTMQLTQIRALLEQTIASLRSPKIPIDELQKYWGDAFKSVPMWSASEIQVFAVLPNDCAVNLSLVKEIMRVTGNAMVDEGKFTAIGETFKQLIGAKACADAAAIELQKIVDTGKRF